MKAKILMGKNQINNRNGIIWLSVGVLIAIICMLLPGNIVKYQANQKKGILWQVSGSNYYSVKYNVINLTLYERLKLISGEWENQIQFVDQNMVNRMSDIPESYVQGNYMNSEGDMECSGYCYLDYQSVIAKAEEGIEKLYELGVYPERANSEYNNWYRPKVELYQVSDAIFESYSCYVWLVQFDYYDGSMSHVLLIDDTSGVILAGGLYGKGDTLSDEWQGNLTEKALPVQNVSSYYAGSQTLDSSVLDVSEEELYLPVYDIWMERFESIASITINSELNGNSNLNSNSNLNNNQLSYMMFEKQEIDNFAEVLEETKNYNDNDKFIYSVGWSDDSFWFDFTPFTVKISEIE